MSQASDAGRAAVAGAPAGVLVAGFDTETHLISAEEIVPRLVCATFDTGQWGALAPTADITSTYDSWIVTNADPELIEQLLVMLRMCLERRTHIIIQNASFDLTVVLRFAMDVQRGLQVGNKSTAEVVYGLVWELLDQSHDDELAGGLPLIHDTIIREKLYNLSTVGALDQQGGRDFRYGLDALVRNYFGIDISGSKLSIDANGRVFNSVGTDVTGTAEAAASWRLRFGSLDSVPLSQWPLEAAQYAIEDATWARKVFVSQESLRKSRGHGSMNSESLQVYADTALRLYSMSGFPVDGQQVERVGAHIETVMKRVESNLQYNGILRPNATVNTKILHQRIAAVWASIDRRPVYTEDTERSSDPTISASAAVLEELAGLDPILDMYAERQSLAKIKSAFMPALQGGRVWTNYDVLKETGRISAYGSSEKGKRKPLYPAVNITQIPRKHGVRECFLPPEGDYADTVGAGPVPASRPPWVYYSCDYSALELCSVAQITYSLFGYSVHREKINQGFDLHTYLGAAMARFLAPHVVDNATNLDAAYHVLRKHATARKPLDADKSPEADHARMMKEEGKKWRTFAKPTGLGYPGGLGPPTLKAMAKAIYGIEMTVEQAKAFRELWHATYPEMKEYFRWVNGKMDMQHPEDELFYYETPGFNRMRARTAYCATANGMAMQSLSADGAKRSACWLARACFGGIRKEENPFALLKGCLPAAFVHDENIMSGPDDELLTERCLLTSELMVRALQVSMPDVRLKAEPALMRRWTKAAEPEWLDDPGREKRVEAALTLWYGSTPPNAWLDDFFAALGPSYNPNRRLVPWDDVHELKLGE